MVGNALVSLMGQSDSITLSVIIILTLLSVIGWSITVYKTILFIVKKRAIKKALNELAAVTTDKELVMLGQKYYFTPTGKLITQTIAHQSLLYNNSYTTLQTSQEYIIDQLLLQEESLISFLSMSAAVAPLLGLFGTVWGLIHSFMSIGMQQSADIATVAPGIAQALITTLVGLCVAIPAVALASYLHGQVRSIEQLLCEFAQKVLFIVMRQKQKKEGQCVSVVVEEKVDQSPMSH